MNFLKKNKTFIIAEVGVNHNGSFIIAKQFVDVAKKVGADAVKFQTYKIKKIYNENYISKSKINWAKKFVLKDYELIKIKDYCKKKKIIFMSTPFEFESANFLNNIGMDIFKVASANIYNNKLLDTISNFKKNVILSSGYSDLKILQKLKKKFKNNKSFSILYCISEYPTTTNLINLEQIQFLKKKLKCNVGYSDHFNGIEFAILAKKYGASIIEKHIKLSDNQICPDSKVSASPYEFKKMVDIIRKIEKSKIYKLKKKKPNIGIYFNQNIKKNETIKYDQIIFLKPNYNTHLKFENLIGKKASKHFKKYKKII